MRRLTKEDRRVLKLVADGEYLSFAALAACTRLEKNGFIETVKTSFISQVMLRITDLGRSALAQSEKKK